MDFTSVSSVMPEPIVDFFVPGIPRSGGSKTGFVNPKTSRVIITESANKANKEWRSTVRHFAFNAYHGDPLDEPLRVIFEFYWPRARSHYRTGRYAGLLRGSAPVFRTAEPDVTKVIRSTEDACTGVIWRDDSLIVEQTARKGFAKTPGCRIIVYRMVIARAPAPAVAPRLFDRREVVA